MAAKLIPKNEAALKIIMRLRESGMHEVTTELGESAKDSIRSLVKCEYIYVTRTILRKTVPSATTHKPLTREIRMYSITDKGRQKLQNLEFPPARTMKSLKVIPVPKFELHKMESFVIPERKPNVREMIAEINGREVRITYGVHHAYEVYKPAPDNSRNYTPRIIRGILA